MLQCERLCFSYEQTPILKQISVAFEDGAVHGVIGPNGSGKSTLLSLLAGLEQPKSGHVLLNGQKIKAISRRELAKQLSVVPQSARLDFDFSVRDVVLMGRHPYLSRFERPRTSDLDIADQAMAALGLTTLGDRPVTALSGGEWQRTLIARALCQDTGTMLLDEPISSLDLAYQIDVLKLLCALAKQGRCVVVALHTLPLALHYTDTLTLMQNGEIVAHGDPEAVLSEENVRAVYHVSSTLQTLPDGRKEFVPNYQ